jgi:hypothetical protein
LKYEATEFIYFFFKGKKEKKKIELNICGFLFVANLARLTTPTRHMVFIKNIVLKAEIISSELVPSRF